MKPGLQVGQIGALRRLVEAAQTITLGDEAPVTVYATPAMIDLMEHAAREALRPFLEANEESVGIDVQVQHTAATPLGAEVRAEAKVTAIEKNVVDFALTAFDPSGPIGQGTHRRAIIQVPRFAARLAEKTAPKEPAEKIDAGQLASFKTITLSVDGPRAVLTLNRPEKRNAIHQAMTRELEQATAWLAEHREVRVVIVTGAGGAFSAGDDIGDLNPDDPEAMRSLSLRRGRLYQRWSTLPQVLLAAIAGPALGGGFICACACDLRIATHKAVFGLPEVTLGWPPNYGLARAISLLGKSRALQYALTGEKLTAREAQDIGFVSQVVPEAQLLPKAQEFADRLLKLPPLALSATKRLLASEPGAASLDEQATGDFVRCLQTAQAKEAVAAFLGRRAR